MPGARPAPACVSGGKLVRDPPDVPPYEFNLTAFKGQHDRYSHCNQPGSYHRWTWRAADRSCKMPTSRDEWCQRFASRSILFVGDSMSGQMYISLVHLLGSAEWPQELAIRYDQKRINDMITSEFRACDGSVHVQFIRNDELIDPSWVVNKNSFTYLLQSHSPNNWPFVKAARAFSTLVLNTGVHMSQTASADTLAARVEMRARFLVGWLNRTQHDVVWRTTVPGHPKCSYHVDPLERETTGPAHYRWDLAAVHNELRLRVFDEGLPPGRLRVLDAYALTRLRADRHLGYVRRSNSEDCLHYCLPGPPDDWNMVLARMLLVNVRRKAGDADME